MSIQRNKFVVFCLMVVLLVVMIPTNVDAASVVSRVEYGNITYAILSDDTAYVYSCDTEASGNVWISSSINGYPVVGIWGHAFSYCNSIESVYIPNSVHTIIGYAFSHCTALTKVDIPSTVTTIGPGAFEYCRSLSSVTIPTGISAIESFTFAHCYALTSVSIPGNVKTIGSYAFESCGLNEVTLKSGVTTIENDAFYSCRSLRSISIPSTLTEIKSYAFYECVSLSNIYLTDLKAWCETKIDCHPFTYHKGTGQYYLNGNKLSGELELPEGIKTIGGFRGGGGITSITIPDSVTTIEYGAFQYCTDLQSVTIPGSVTTIDSYAFYNCDSLTDVYITDPIAWCKISFGGYYSNPMHSGDYLHVLDENGNEVTEVTLDNTVTAIPDYAFRGSTITAIAIPDSVTTIGASAFENCSELKSITIPNGVTAIGNYAFKGCSKLQSTTIPNGVTTISDYAFQYCTSLTNIIIPDSVTSIGNRAFYNCSSLTNIIIPDSVTSIGNLAFDYCTSLTSVTIPGSVTSIGIGAFSYCTDLENVYYARTKFWWDCIDIDTGNSCLTDATIHYSHIHEYSVVNVQPSCTEGGYKQYTCIHGESYQETFAALGHDYSGYAEQIVPTCTEQGYTLTHCIRCESVEKSNFVETIPHDYTLLPTVTVQPSCSQDGYVEYTCIYGDTYREPIAALGHDYSGAVSVIAPTCKEQGYTQTQCSRCDSISKTNYTSTINHKMALLPAVAPTCEKPGLTVGTACQMCGLVGLAQKEEAALGGSCDYTADPTTCGNCGYVRADISINNVVLRPTYSGLYFKGAFTFGAHETVTRYGIVVSVYNELPVADDSDATSLYTIGNNSVLISNILDSSNGKTLIYARAYVLLEDGTYIYGDVVATNLQTVVETISSKWDTLTDAQKAAIADMYRQNTAVMQVWLIPEIKEYV